MRWSARPLLLLFLAAVGCKSVPPVPPLPVKTVAVLPFNNGSNDIGAPDLLQGFTYAALKRSSLEVRDVRETNEFLEKNAGVHDGGQLAAVDPVELAKALGVQALLYGSVDEFGYTNVGFYRSRVVKLELKLVDATGAVLWQHAGTGSHRDFALDKRSAEKAFFIGLADQLTDKVFRSPLDEEARQATADALRTLPGFRFAGFDGDAGGVKAGVRNAIKTVIRQ